MLSLLITLRYNEIIRVFFKFIRANLNIKQLNILRLLSIGFFLFNPVYDGSLRYIHLKCKFTLCKNLIY